MKALEFRLVLQSPVLVAQVGAGEENSSVAYSYIPGSSIRGALIARYLQMMAGMNISTEPTARRLFLDGTVCYLNGYIEGEKRNRCLPVPLSWREPKDRVVNGKDFIYDFAVKDNQEIKQPKELGKKYVNYLQDDHKVEISEVKSTLQVHNSSQERFIKRKGDSTVFRYEALPSGLVFRAVIVSQDQQLLMDVEKLLKSSPMLTLGGSRQAGYGLVKVEPVTPGSDTYIKQAWKECPSGEAPSKVIIVTLLSDCIILDNKGQQAPDLSSITGVPHLRAFKHQQVQGAFNRTWGLPIDQSMAISAGSVFIYPYSDALKDKLSSMQEQGIGERRAEGFGRFAVNWNTREMWVKDTKGQVDSAQPQTDDKILLKDTDSLQLANRMAASRLRYMLDQRLTRAVAMIEINNKKSIKNAQLSRLRQVVARSLGSDALQNVQTHMRHLKSTARDQFQTTWITWKTDDNGKPDPDGQIVVKKRLEDWINGCMVDGQVWKDWFWDKDTLPSIAGQKAQITPNLQVEYLARLLDGVLRKFSRKEAVEEEE